MLLQHGILRLNVMWVTTQQNLDLVHVGGLVIAQFPLHAILDMSAVRVQVV